MRKHSALAMATVACTLLSVHAEPTPSSLCTAVEVNLFTCKSGHTNVISVCASRDATATAGSLVYRFGQIGKTPSLSYPEKLIPPQDAFKFAQGCAASGCTEQLAFSIGEFHYTVYSEHHGGVVAPAMDAGVFVERAGREVADFRCTDPLAPTDMYLIGNYAGSGSTDLHFLGLTSGELRDDVGPGDGRW